MRRKKQSTQAPDAAAGNGLLDRRIFLTGGAAAAAASAMPDRTLGAEALPVEPWMKTPGSPFVATTWSLKTRARIQRFERK